MKVFGIDREKCEHPNCNKKARLVLMTGWQWGFNTWVYCKEHYQINRKKLSV